MNSTESMIESRSQLGSRVRELRRKQHLTQLQLGQIVGLNRSQISRLECGHGSATLDTILLVANGLGVTPTELFDGIAPVLPNGNGGIPVMLSLPDSQTVRYHATKL